MTAKLIDPPRRVLAGLAVLLGMAGVITLSALSERGVEPGDAAGFDTERAMTSLEEFATEPRPVGSAANERTERYLVEQLEDAGLTVEVQRAVGANSSPGRATFGRVDNIIATLPGSDPTGTLFLAAHFDSSEKGPGAADDGAAVAAMLETVRAVGQPRNDLVVLITDGEEEGLLGAEAFVREHPLGQDGGVLLNFEARGVRGPSLMFETSRDNAALAELFTDTAPNPRGDSSMVEVYRLLPNNTDFTVFAANGFEGLNFAFIEGAARYHTEGDSIEHLDRGSLAHHGENMVALTRELGGADLTTLSADNDDTYFRVLGLSVSYPNGAVWPLAVLALLLVVALTWLARRWRLATASGVLVGAATAVVPLLVAFGLGQGLWSVLVWLRPTYDVAGGLLHRPVAYHAAMIGLGLLALLAWYLPLRRRLGPVTLAIAGLVWPALLGIPCAVFAPGAAFLFTVPVLLAAAGAIVALAVDRPLWSVVAVGLGLVVATALLPYFGYMVFVAVGLELGGAGSLFVVLFGLFALPVVELLVPERRVVLVPAGVVLLSVALAGVGLVVDTRDADHPAPTHLAYVLDADTGRAHWVSEEVDATDWTGRYVTGDGISTGTSGLPPGFADGEMLTGDAPQIDVEAPEAELVSRDGDTLTVLVTSPRGAPHVTLRVSEPITEVTAALHDTEGSDPVTVAVEDTRTGTWPGEIRFRDLPPEGVELTIRTAAEVRLTVFDESPGLEDVPEFEPRPSDLVAGPQHDGDVVCVARTYEF